MKPFISLSISFFPIYLKTLIAETLYDLNNIVSNNYLFDVHIKKDTFTIWLWSRFYYFCYYISFQIISIHIYFRY